MGTLQFLKDELLFTRVNNDVFQQFNEINPATCSFIQMWNVWKYKHICLLESV